MKTEDPLGDRRKRYEAVEAGRRFDPARPVRARNGMIFAGEEPVWDREPGR